MTTNNQNRKRRSVASLLAGALAFGTLTLTQTSFVRAAAPANGPLVYSYGGSGGVKVVNLDGTSSVAPKFMNGSMNASFPTYSQDGTKVVWVEVANNQQTEYKLYVANVDGSNKKLLTTTTSVRITKPQLTADNSKVIFYKGGGGTAIYSVDATVENQTLSSSQIILQLSSGAIMDLSVSSTDKLAYVSTTACTGAYGAMTRSIAGVSSNVGTLLTGSCNAASTPTLATNSVQWQADGLMIFLGFSTYNSGTQARTYGISVTNDTGSNAHTTITSTTATVGNISLSPDGRKLAFGTIAYTTPPSMTLYTMGMDGSGKTTIATSSDALAEVTWAQVFPADTTTTTAAPATTVPRTTVAPTTTTTLAPKPVAGQTISDPTVYTTAPAKVTSESAINVLTATEAKTQKIVSLTPNVCLPTNDEIVFIDEGRCSANILNKKSGEVIRRMRTTVIDSDVITLDVGNEVAVLAPIFFDGGSAEVKASGIRRIRGLKSQIDAAGTVMVVGHSGILMGDTAENRELSRKRATNTVKEMKRLGATGPFYSIGVGIADPAVETYSIAAQKKNRRVVIVLVP